MKKFRNFINGKHVDAADGSTLDIINPATGRPVNHSLLSATVLAKDCMTADAYATAMMVMGTEKAIELQKSRNLFEIFLIYSDSTGQLKSFASDGIKPFLSFPQD